jgi:hypothetical protein
MTVTNKDRRVEYTDGSDSPDGWKRIVSAVVIAATAIGTLWLTDSIENTATVVALVLLPLGVTLRG